MWLIMIGQRRNELTITEAYQSYRQRYDERPRVADRRKGMRECWCRTPSSFWQTKIIAQCECYSQSWTWGKLGLSELFGLCSIMGSQKISSYLTPKLGTLSSSKNWGFSVSQYDPERYAANNYRDWHTSQSSQTSRLFCWTQYRHDSNEKNSSSGAQKSETARSYDPDYSLIKLIIQLILEKTFAIGIRESFCCLSKVQLMLDSVSFSRY